MYKPLDIVSVLFCLTQLLGNMLHVVQIQKYNNTHVQSKKRTIQPVHHNELLFSWLNVNLLVVPNLFNSYEQLFSISVIVSALKLYLFINHAVHLDKTTLIFTKIALFSWTVPQIKVWIKKFWFIDFEMVKYEPFKQALIDKNWNKSECTST